MRVTPDHWNTFLDFAEQNPELITNRYHGIHGNIERNNLWTKAANSLNALGHGQKTVAQWRKAVTDWKAKTKAKLSKPYNEIALTRTERRLLTLMGKQALRKRRKLIIIPGPGENRAEPTITSQQEEDPQAGHNYAQLIAQQNIKTEPEDLTIESSTSTNIHTQENLRTQTSVHTQTNTLTITEDSDSSIDVKHPSSSGKQKARRHKEHRHNPLGLGKAVRQSETIAVMHNIGSNVEKISNSMDKLVTIYEKLTEFCERMLARQNL